MTMMILQARAKWVPARRAIAAALVLLCLGMGLLQPVAAQVRDVPRGHWAYDAVTALVEAGYLSTFDDGTFRGEEPVQRYTFAAALYQILKEVEAGATRVDAADVELLRRLATEFRDELVEFYRLRDQLLGSVADSEKKIVVFDETLNRVIDVVTILEADTAALRAELARETEALRTLLAEQTEGLRQEVETGRSITQAALRGELLDIIAQLQAEAEEINARLAHLEQDVDEAWEETLWLSERLEEVYGRLGPLDERVGEMETRTALAEAQLAALRSEVTDLRAGLEGLQAESEERWASHETRLQELQSGVNALEETVAAHREDLLERMSELREGLLALVASEGSQIAERLAQASELLEGDVAALAQRLDDLQQRLASVEATAVLLDQQLSEERERTRLALDGLLEDTELLLDASEMLFDELEQLQGRLTALQQSVDRELPGRMARLESRMDALDARVGFSDEEIALLTERVRDELANQLNLSLAREQRLQRELEELKQEFEGYRAAKDEETRSLRGTTNIAIAAAVIGILVGLFTK